MLKNICEVSKYFANVRRMSSATVPPAQYYSFGMITVGVDGSYHPDWYLILYYIVCLSIAASVCGWLWNKGQQVAALVTAVLLIFIFIYFDYRWFPATPTPPAPACVGGSGGDSAGCKPTTWPPIVNMCPDYFVGWTNPTDSKIYCYDANNTYGMKTAVQAGQVQVSINGVSSQAAYLVMDPKVNTSVTPTCSGVANDTGGSRYPLYHLFKNSSGTITNDSLGKYIRWEGVWDGVTLNAANILRGMPS